MPVRQNRPIRKKYHAKWDSSVRSVHSCRTNCKSLTCCTKVTMCSRASSKHSASFNVQCPIERSDVHRGWPYTKKRHPNKTVDRSEGPSRLYSINFVTLRQFFYCGVFRMGPLTQSDSFQRAIVPATLWRKPNAWTKRGNKGRLVLQFLNRSMLPTCTCGHLSSPMTC